VILSLLYAFVQEHRRCGELDGGVEGRPRVDDVLVRLSNWPLAKRHGGV